MPESSAPPPPSLVPDVTADHAPPRSAAVRVPVTIYGFVRGAELGGRAVLVVADDALRLDPYAFDAETVVTRPPRAFDYETLDGMRADAGTLALYLHGGDVVELALDASQPSSHDLDAAAAAITARAHALPELTRALRGFGSRRARPGTDHDRFFAPLVAPLVASRQAADRGDGPQALLDAFDAGRIRAAVAEALTGFATARYPASAPDRRALDAELQELAEGFYLGLVELGVVADAVRQSPLDVRFARWREWAATLVRVFERADYCWLTAVPVLVEAHAAASQPRGWRRLGRLFGFGARALLLASLAGGPLAAGPLGAQEVTARAVVRVAGDATARLRAADFDVVGVRGGDTFVVADSLDQARLTALGLVAQVVRAATPAADVARQRSAATVVYRSFDEPARGVRVLLDSMARANPRVRLDTLGFTLERRPILAVKIGAADDSPARPNVLYMATYHAREWAATEMALRLARHLAQPTGGDARLDSLVARRDVWVLPVANPDGYQHAFDVERLWRKNRRPLGEVAGQAEFGVDLNRNHSEGWGQDDQGSSPSPRSEVYRGPAPASELEVQAIERFHLLHPPVASVSYHTFSGMVLFPPGNRFGLLPGDLGIFRTLAGTDEQPAVLDRLPGSDRGYYRPTYGWQLYVTNGEYTDWAYGRLGTIAFTPEITSGFGTNGFYDFRFPDDETLLERLFRDNLPFALDVLESAADPLRYVSPTTGLRSERVAIESVFPRVRVRVPGAAATGPSAVVSADGAMLRTRVDTLGDGRHTFRAVSDDVAGRPREVRVRAGSDSARYTLLLAGGAEPSDTGWTVTGFVAEAGGVAGARHWSTEGVGRILSPAVTVPLDVDTVTVMLWTRYVGDPSAADPRGTMSLAAADGTLLDRVMTMAGLAPEYYPESRTIGGVRGRTLRLSLDGTRMPWRVDEVAMVAHSPTRSAPVGGTVAALQPSENPVRGSSVSFAWPYAEGGADGDLLVYDFSGRLVFRTSVQPASERVTWPLGEGPMANGAYVVIARSGGRTTRQTVYVLRPAR
jgi:hypothetical protein